MAPQPADYPDQRLITLLHAPAQHPIRPPHFSLIPFVLDVRHVKRHSLLCLPPLYKLSDQFGTSPVFCPISLIQHIFFMSLASLISSSQPSTSESSSELTKCAAFPTDTTPPTPPPSPTLFLPPVTTIQATAGMPFHGRIPLVCTRTLCYIYLWDSWHRGVIIAWSPSSQAYLVYIAPSQHIIAIAGAFIRVDPIDLPFPCNLNNSSPFLDIWPHSLMMSYSAIFHRSHIISPPNMEPLNWDDDEPWTMPSPERYVIPAWYAEQAYRTQPVSSTELSSRFSEEPTRAQILHLQVTLAARLLGQKREGGPQGPIEHSHVSSPLRYRIRSGATTFLRSLASFLVSCFPKA